MTRDDEFGELAAGRSAGGGGRATVTEEQRVRGLLTAAAELPDLAPAPVDRLIASGRRRRARTRILAGAAVAVAVAAAVAIPASLRGAAAPIATVHGITLPAAGPVASPLLSSRPVTGRGSRTRSWGATSSAIT
jgi:hypothetical protein